MDLLDTLSDPEKRHAALVHFPIVLAMLLPIAITAAALRPRDKSLTGVALAIGALLVISGMVASSSGETLVENMATERMDGYEAYEEVYNAGVRQLVEDHEGAAERIYLMAVAPLVFFIAGVLIKKEPLAATLRGVAVALAFALAAWTAYAASLGGQLVYDHGVGIVDR
ncbi:MAG: DUF2231 domain-containing protein [Planctomycetota bacterium]